MAQHISDVMTSNPATVQASAPLIEAARCMKEQNIGDVIVMNDGKLAGVVTDRDLVVRGIAEGREPATTKVRDVCSDDVATVSPDDAVEDAVRLMREQAVRRLPVVDGDKPIGIVSIGDLAIERDSESALADISAARPNR